MKMVLILCAFMNSIYGRPQNSPQVEIVENNLTLKEKGAFSFRVSTSDGFVHEATGKIKNIGTPEEGLSVKGSYSYISSDGSIYEVKYIADDKGFQPDINILPPTVLRTGSQCLASICGTGLG